MALLSALGEDKYTHVHTQTCTHKHAHTHTRTPSRLLSLSPNLLDLDDGTAECVQRGRVVIFGVLASF